MDLGTGLQNLLYGFEPRPGLDYFDASIWVWMLEARRKCHLKRKS